MKHCILLIFISLTFLFSKQSQAQFQSALDFDGTDDEVRVPAGVQLVAGSSEVSLSAWVKLNDQPPGFPDFNGIVGFRDEFSADFYLLQLSATQIEARFRNSNGTEFTIAHTGDFQTSVWQHMALTYDGSMLRLWMGGVQVDSISANGTLANSGGDLMIGFLDFQSFTFSLLGQLDEVGLWNRTLTGDEINCMISSRISPQSQGLQVYLDMNEGIPSGENTPVTGLINQAGTLSATISNMALSGSVSNFVDGINNYTTTNATFCGSAIQFGSQTITEPGNYYQSYDIGTGCDSLAAMIVTGFSVDTAVTQSGNNLIANATAVSYQWINCATGQSIAGAVNQSFTPSQNGSYAVVVSDGECSDTSSCRQVIISGINMLESDELLTIYPNPSVGLLHMNHPLSIVEANLVLRDLQGKVHYSCRSTSPNSSIILPESLSNGVYFVELSYDGYRVFKRFVLSK